MEANSKGKIHNIINLVQVVGFDRLQFTFVSRCELNFILIIKQLIFCSGFLSMIEELLRYY